MYLNVVPCARLITHYFCRKMPLDYRKWDHIEVSDDEDDTHPNIDTPSLFKWRHEARIKRMEEMEAKKKAAADEKKKYVIKHALINNR